MKVLKSRNDLINIFFIIALTILFFAGVLFGNYKIPWDAYDQQYPWMNTLFKDGKLNIWSDSYFSGFPIFEDPQVGTFYPFNWVLSFFADKETGYLSYDYIELSLVFHYCLMGIFTYILCRNLKLSKSASLFGAILFEFCGYIACHPQHYSSIISITWLPLTLTMLIRIYDKNKIKDSIIFILSFALSILGGHIQTALYSGMFLLFITCILTYKKVKENKKDAITFFARICLLFLLGGLIGGIQLLPTLELMKNSTRNDMTYSEFSTSYNTPINLITAIIPYFMDISNTWYSKEPTETHLYISIVFFVLIAVNMTIKNRDNEHKQYITSDIWILSGIVFFLLSLGKSTFLNRIMYVIPFVNKLRRSVNYMYVVSLVLGIISAYIVDNFLSNCQKIKVEQVKKVINKFIVFFGIMLIIAYLYLFGLYEVNGKIDDKISDIINGLWITSIIILIVKYIITSFVNNKISNKLFVVLLNSILVLDLFTFNSNVLPNASLKSNIGVSYNDLNSNTEVNKILRQAEQDNFRVAFCGVGGLNLGGVIGISDIWGYNPMRILNYEYYTSQFNLSETPQVGENTDFSSNLVDLLSLKYIVTTQKYIEENGTISRDKYKIIYEKDDLVILENLKCVPMYYTVNEICSLNEIDVVYDELKESNFDYKQKAYILNNENQSYETSNLVKIAVNKKSSNKIELSIVAEEDTYMVTSKIMYNGWKIRINGENKDVDCVNGIFIGTQIPKGENVVEIVYEPLMLYFGMISVIVGVIGTIIYLVIQYKLKKRC